MGAPRAASADSSSVPATADRPKVRATIAGHARETSARTNPALGLPRDARTLPDREKLAPDIVFIIFPPLVGQKTSLTG